ncbi:MAG: oligosaccharide flippase family protein [Saprospiraceae bacterium]|nr:oligosaccharide flippase family protein [Saprospiraceae bacterium]
MLKKIYTNMYFQSLFATGASSAIAMGSFMILTRVMEVEDFGEWVLYLTLLTFVDQLRIGLVASGLIKYSGGCEVEEKKELIGSSWVINIISLLVITFVFQLFYWLNISASEGLQLFILFYPLYGFFSMPFNYFRWNSEVALEFKKITYIQLFNSFGFLLVCIVAIFIQFTLQQIVILNIMVFGLSSVICLFRKESGVDCFFSASKSSIYKILSFGKFHLLAHLGAHLLRSVDIVLIGVFLSPVAVAIYGVATRMVVLIALPLNSIVKVAFPLLSTFVNKGEIDNMRNTLEKYIGIVSFLYIPLIFILYLFSTHLILLIGGENYIDAVYVFQIFLLASLFISFNKLLGVALDSLGLPNLNFYRLMLMALVNILGDIFVLYFYESIELVAFVTLVNILVGVVVGYLMLRWKIRLQLRFIFSNSIKTILYYLTSYFNIKHYEDKKPKI